MEKRLRHALLCSLRLTAAIGAFLTTGGFVTHVRIAVEILAAP